MHLNRAAHTSNGRPPSIPCPHCRGTGLVELTGVYADTLLLLRAQSGEVNGADLARLAGVKGEAMANRLVRLERLGLAVGRRYGRERLWKAM
jgi:Mn-dependent DtxR family transcriptional regulator